MKSWSTKILVGTMALMMVAIIPLNAQSKNAKTVDAPVQSQPALKPQLALSDVVFTLNILATVNISGSEVEAYVDVKNTFARVFDQAQKDKKAETDVITVEMSMLTANNFLQLLQRANLQGSAAEKFLSVKNALYASAPKTPSSETQSQNQGNTGQK